MGTGDFGVVGVAERSLVGWMLVLSLAGCRNPSVTRPESPPVVAQAPGATLVGGVSVTPERGDPPSQQTGGIACGATRCATGSQICCGFSGEQVCAKRYPDDPKVASLEERFSRQIEACSAALKTDYSLDQLSYCDDSADCASGQVCCANQLWGGAGFAECRTLPSDGRSPCEFNELCDAGKPCVLPATECVDGTCRRSGRKLACGAETCSAPKALCCVQQGKPSCTAPSACKVQEGHFGAACRGPADCPKGEWCCEGVGASYCASECINAATVCESVRDCPPDYAGVRLKGCSPDPEAPLPLKICDYDL
jgi:hypothetical protein